MGRWVRLAVLVCWPPLLALAVMASYGRLGFNPTDPGFILAGSWRIAHGQVPHLDLISARPLGSALLHVIDLALPGPLLVASGVFAVLEVAVAALALTALVTRRSPLTWGIGLTAGTIAASLVNLHTFPITAWHTVDGVLFTALGWWSLDCGVRANSFWRRYLGLALVGFATLTKQSFAPAALIALVIAWRMPAGGPTGDPAAGARRRPAVRVVVADLAALLLAPVGYLAWVTAAGGLSDLVRQVLGGQGVWGHRLLIGVWRPLADRPAAALALLGYALLLVACATLSVRARRAGRVRSANVWALLRGAAGLAVLGEVLAGRLALNGDWGAVLAWMLAGAIALTVVETRRLPRRALAVLALGWMVSLSWGYDTPDLVGGSLALTTLVLLWGRLSLPWPVTGRAGSGDEPGRRTGWAPRLPVAAGALAAVLVALAAAGLFASARTAHTYRELPAARLSKDAGAIDPAMRGIKVGARTYTYLSQVKSCLASYPARQVAVLPDNAGLYPVFGLRDPFPIDWMTRMELVGDARARILAEADALSRDGHYLVLFETVDARLLAITNVPARVSPSAKLVDDSAPLLSEVRSALHGQRVTCGSFVGVWQR
jgi:hypothetical protein